MEKLLFTELRIMRGNNDNLKSTSKAGLELALIDNENLNALGYELKGEGIVKLAKEYTANPERIPLHVLVKEFEPDIEASPMYPNFPIQVLEMNELEFRIHQLMHYLTTYGLEDMLGVEVNEGWLPKTEDLMERVEDKQVAKLKTLDFMSPNEVNEFVIEKLIGKNERLLPNELKIAKEVIKVINRPQVFEIPFKENIGAIYGDTLLNGNLEERYEALSELAVIMRHPGDVLDLVEHLVVLNNYKHFKTSLKRGLVELLESFPEASLEENLASNRWSNKFLGKKGKPRSINRNIALIDYLSFNRFSNNKKAQDLVNQLKDGQLLSWNQKLERAYESRDYSSVLNLLRQRPGVYFRQINRLHKLNVPANILKSDMKELAHELKTQSIVSALNNYTGSDEVKEIFRKTLISNLNSKEIEELKGKKVFVEQSEIDLLNSKIEITDKFEEGGYIQAGIAVKIPEDAEFVRFFTYWNDDRRIDIDLHAAYDRDSEYNGHIGWNKNYKIDGLAHSGDITHSNAAEYIDINLEEAKQAGVTKVQFNINSFTGVRFKDIEEVFAGLMVLGEMGKKVKLYDQKNVLFRHDIENNSMAVDYAFIDLQKGFIRILGKTSNIHNDRNLIKNTDVNLSIGMYISILLATQGCEAVTNREDADIIIGLSKSDEENYISLIDKNFFM